MTRRSCEYCSAAASDEPPPATMVLPDDMLARVARSAGEERSYGTESSSCHTVTGGYARVRRAAAPWPR